MELVSAAPSTEIEFEASLPQNLLTVASLLRAAGRFEGLSEWIVQTAATLPSDSAADLRTLSLVTAVCPGLWSDFICAGRGLGPMDFDALLARLDQLGDKFVRAARRGLDGYLTERELADAGAAQEAGYDAMASLLARAWAERQHQGEGAGDETRADAEQLARLLTEADLLRDQAVTTLRGLWAIYRERGFQDWIQIERAVTYHQLQRYPHEFNAAFVAMTGRTVPDRLGRQLDRIRRVVMTPVRHIGPYLLLTQLDDGIMVSFNADMAPAGAMPEDSIAALYPPLKALADETRLQIVSLLVDNERYVGEIAELLDLSPSSASRHLNLLTAAEILTVRRESNQKYFRINPARARALMADLQHLLRL